MKLDSLKSNARAKVYAGYATQLVRHLSFAEAMIGRYMIKVSGVSVLKKSICALFILTALNFLSCAKSADSTTTTSTPTDGSQSAAQLAGTGTFCATDSTIGGTYAYTHSLTLNSNGTYTYTLYFSDATSCATGQNTGGNNFATYSQSGSYVVGGSTGTPSTGTKITFTVTSGALTIRPGSYNETATQNLITWINSCSGTLSFSTSVDQTKSVNANSCSGSGSYTAVTIPANGDTFTNTVYNGGTILYAGVASGQDVWRPGGASYPNSYTQQYLSW